MKLPASLRIFFSSTSFVRALIAAVAVLLTIFMQWAPTDAGSYFANEWLRDRFIRLQASSEPETRITLIDIDEESLTAIGPWPWPRDRIADLVENLVGQYGARGVALDLVFPEPADKAGDLRLATLTEHGPVVLAQVLDYVTRPLPLQVGQITGGFEPRTSTSAVTATGHIGNHAGLRNAKHVGNIGFVPDADGKIRHLPILSTYGGRYYPTLSVALSQCCLTGGAGGQAIGQASVPVPQGRDGFWRVPYSRTWSAYSVVSAADILQGKAPEDLIRNRLVIVGSSSLGLADRVATPLAASTSGVLVHAAALSTILDQQENRAATAWPGRWIAILFTLLVAGVATYTFPRLSALSNIALLAATSIAWIGLAYLIAPHDPDFSTTGPIASTLFLLAVGVPFDWQIAQRKSRSLLGTLRQYVATAVVDELLRSGLKDPLTPRELDVTTLIADIQGYTTLVEALSIEDAARLTRDLLACLTKPVLQLHGTIDKYTGDGLVAFWGAPLPVEDHADLALDAAQAMVEEVRRFSETRKLAGSQALRVRIGIESGLAMAGDFGTGSRSIYTAVGDSVNVAARLEQVARHQPHDIIIGAGTVERAHRHHFKLLGEFTLRGKEKTNTLYTLEQPAMELSA